MRRGTCDIDSGDFLNGFSATYLYAAAYVQDWLLRTPAHGWWARLDDARRWFVRVIGFRE
jgi:hypothetical protein